MTLHPLPVMKRILPIASAVVALGLGSPACSRDDAPRPLATNAREAGGGCLPYGPRIVGLSGRMERMPIPGPPNRKSEKEDEPATQWILQLPRTVCTQQGSDPEGKGRELNVILVQLMLSFEQYGMYRDLLGQNVVASGTLMDSRTSYFPTPLVLQVLSLRATTPADSLR